MDDDTITYYGSKPTIYRSYAKMAILGYLNITCCIIGSILNFFVIIVFTRKNMISPINTILVHLAIAETITMITYMPHTWHEFFRANLYPAIKDHRTHEWETISLASFYLAFIFRHTTIWLTLVLGVWRYIAVIYPLKERKWCQMETTRVCIIAGYVFGLMTCIPLWFFLQIKQAEKTVDKDGVFTSDYGKGVKNESIFEIHAPIVMNTPFYRLIYLSYGIFVKIIPTAMLGVISYKLIIALSKAKTQHEGLTSNSHFDNTRQLKNKHQTYRITVMLLMILGLLVVGELPHGIYCLLTAILGPKFYTQRYSYAAEVFNTLVKFCECANFVIYYIMSHRFRNTFKALFRSRNGDEKKIRCKKRTSSFSRYGDPALVAKALKFTDSSTKTTDE
ncbi:G-protein coupled receptor dmsr-1-like [Planococcus citri]|uniref:G-protein coupled receptor dmsr-1-like n=1 Tax=Planococcus citri TaxID=170843 RepID=UPI0031F87B54